MTAFETWISENVAIALRDMQNTDADGQRVACVLIQARAQEDRHMATELLLRCPGQVPAIQLSGWLTERSHKLEALGLKIAEPDGWPLKEQAPVEKPSGLVLVKH